METVAFLSVWSLQSLSGNWSPCPGNFWHCSLIFDIGLSCAKILRFIVPWHYLADATLPPEPRWFLNDAHYVHYDCGLLHVVFKNEEKFQCSVLVSFHHVSKVRWTTGPSRQRSSASSWKMGSVQFQQRQLVSKILLRLFWSIESKVPPSLASRMYWWLKTKQISGVFIFGCWKMGSTLWLRAAGCWWLVLWILDGVAVISFG